MCSICLEPFKINEEVIKLDCNEGHIFHFGCIENWIEVNITCPLCRKTIINLDKVSELELNGAVDPSLMTNSI